MDDRNLFNVTLGLLQLLSPPFITYNQNRCYKERNWGTWKELGWGNGGMSRKRRRRSREKRRRRCRKKPKWREKSEISLGWNGKDRGLNFVEVEDPTLKGMES